MRRSSKDVWPVTHNVTILLAVLISFWLGVLVGNL
jgi:hypothetical protein